MSGIPVENTRLIEELSTAPGGLQNSDLILVSRPNSEPTAGDYGATILDLMTKIRPNIIPWSLAPSAQLARLTEATIPAPYNVFFYNVINIVGTHYSCTWTPPQNGTFLTGGFGVLATFPLASSKSAFWWKPINSDPAQSHRLTISNLNTLNEYVSFEVVPGLGLRVQIDVNDTYIDPDMVLGETVLIQISDTYEISVKTPRVESGILGTMPSTAGAAILIATGVTNGGPTVQGDLGATDLGSGIVPDAGYVPLQTLSSAVIPNTAKNGGSHRVNVTYNFTSLPTANYAVYLENGASVTGTFNTANRTDQLPVNIGVNLIHGLYWSVNFNSSDVNNRFNVTENQISSFGIVFANM